MRPQLAADMNDDVTDPIWEEFKEVYRERTGQEVTPPGGFPVEDDEDGDYD